MLSNLGNTVIETESFVRQASALWSEAELNILKDYLAYNPLSGKEIPGTKGLRKLRWRLSDTGKRGGARVIYFPWAGYKPSPLGGIALAVRSD